MHQNPARDALRTIDAPLDPDSPSTFDATGAYHPSPDTLPIVSGPAGVLPSIPGYALTGEIARGGMGRVLAGRELSLDREVAIKVLLPGADAGRFVTESKITAKLPHPNIPPVYALGALDDGSPFLAMKYVRGRTLADELTVRPDLKAELLEIQTALLEGILAMRLGQFEIAERVLRKAHARTDAKYGGDHLVTLSLRLGIVSSLASMKRHDEAERTLLDIQALATKKFGDTSLIGMSCDIYLGGLDGAKPNADPERSNNRYLAAIEAAKKLHLEHLQVLLPAHLSLALYYAENNKHPLALEHALRAEVLVTGPPVGSEESKRLVLFAKAVALLQLGRYAEAEPLCTKLMASVDKNKEPANYRYIEFAYCKALTLSGKFAEAEPICVRLLENCEQPPRAAPKQTALAHVFHLHIAIGLSRMNTVRAELTQIATACEKLPEAGRNDILAELRAAGRRASDQKKPEFAVAIHADAHRHYKRYFTMNHNETAVSAGDLAHALGVVGRQDGREQLYREAMDGTKAALGADHEYTRLCANNLVALYRTAGKNAEATAVLTTLYEWVATKNGPSNEVASQRAWQAIDLCKQLGRHADAVPVARKLVDALSAVTGADDWKRADARMALGECLLASGQTREAAVVLAQSLATGRLTHAGTTALAVNQTWLAEALIGEKKYAEAELLLLEAYPKLRADPTTRMATPADRAAERLVQLYTLTNKPDESKKWQAERAKYPVPTTLDDGSAATLPGLVATAKANPSDTILSIKLAALQTWHGHTADLGETQAWALKSAHATTDPATAERAAKTCCLRASEDKERLKVALALARRAAELGKDQPLHHYFWMALGMAEFRNGNFLAADKALTTAGFTDPVNEHVYLPSAFYRAMSLHRLGEEDEAKSIAKAAAAKMKPYPKDTGKPFADGYNADDLIVFLAYQEAAAMLQLDPKTRETLTPPRPAAQK